VRGGAIPILTWGSLLAVLGVINWIWTDDAIQVATFACAVFVALSVVVTLALRTRREALRPGPPRPPSEPEAVPLASLGSFLVYFGAGLLVASLGRVSLELRSERRSRERWLRDRVR
jgi:hypothetical protein